MLLQAVPAMGSSARLSLDVLLQQIHKSRFFPLYGWMDELQFYVLFNSISVISGRLVDDNERLCAMEPCLGLERFHLQRGSNSGLLDQ